MKKLFFIGFTILNLSILFSCKTTMNVATNPTNSTETNGTTNSTVNTTTNATTNTTTTATTTSPYSPIYDVAPSSDMCDDLEDMGDWKIAWCDEFNYRGLPDSSKWKYDTGGNGWGNNELQYYKAGDRDNVFVEDDNLVITAIKEKFNNNNYTSTRLVSAGKYEFLYGKVEIRAKLPGEKGTWPALWMLGNFGKYGWPKCGEIDIMEHVANDLNVIHGSIHTENYYHKINTQKTDKMVLNDVVNEYHIYGIEWTPKQIRFFIDGINYFTFNNDEINNPDNSHGNWPFDEKMFFILNIAIGGWGGNVDPYFDQAKMYVDYVRVYQKEFDNVDTTNPSDITNIQLVTNSPTKSQIIWDATNDNIGIKYYEVFLNDTLQGKTEVPNYTFTNLNQNENYSIKIVAHDFAGNRSNPSSYTLTTTGFPSILEKIEAEDYIEMHGIQTENTSDTGGGQNIGWTDNGDYLVYKVNVQQSGTYKVTYRIASQSLGGTIDLYSNDTLLVSKSFASTSGWQNWTSVESTTFNLEAGLHTLKLNVAKSGFNLNYFEFTKVE